MKPQALREDILPHAFCALLKNSLAKSRTNRQHQHADDIRRGGALPEGRAKPDYAGVISPPFRVALEPSASSRLASMIPDRIVAP